MNRAIIIYHPDFDKLGKEGIERAKSFAEDLQTGNRQYIEALREEGAPAAVLSEAMEFLGNLQYYIRKVDF